MDNSKTRGGERLGAGRKPLVVMDRNETKAIYIRVKKEDHPALLKACKKMIQEFYLKK